MSTKIKSSSLKKNMPISHLECVYAVHEITDGKDGQVVALFNERTDAEFWVSYIERPDPGSKYTTKDQHVVRRIA